MQSKIVSFFKHPYYQANKLQISRENCKEFTVTVLVCYAAIIGVVLFLVVLDLLLVHMFHFHSILYQLAETRDMLIKHSPVVAICAFTIVPLIEELIFRLPLVPKKYFVFVSGILFLYISLGGKSYNTIFFHNCLKVTIFIILSLWLYFIISNITFAKISDFIHKHYRTYFYFLTLSFGLLHIFNADTIQWQIFYLYPLYVLPQIILGFAIAYLRNTLHFVYGLALHILVNLISILLH
ncbi:MAG: hypothetical protein LBG96_06505 [Tannerella sp.]|jgi:hypothetical protein|nr:hypothetical protein [Tannerella sp.]